MQNALTLEERLDLRTWLSSLKKPTNVSAARHLSPFRYPGGKTWLIPTVRLWLEEVRARCLVEPFAGGGIVGLTAANESLVEQVVLNELDEDVASVWQLIFRADPNDIEWLLEKIATFDINEDNVRHELNITPAAIRERAWQTLLRNRVQRGGILAPGAGLVRSGENGRGIASRWYPDTLIKRIRHLIKLRDRIIFNQQDALELIPQFSRQHDVVLFIDPPYTAGGKRAGKRLYRHNDVDHERLFRLSAQHSGPVMMTYDDTPEVRALAEENDFEVWPIPMKNTHHVTLFELILLKG